MNGLDFFNELLFVIIQMVMTETLSLRYFHPLDRGIAICPADDYIVSILHEWVDKLLHSIGRGNEAPVTRKFRQYGSDGEDFGHDFDFRLIQ
jgi:hypothetical protein